MEPRWKRLPPIPLALVVVLIPVLAACGGGSAAVAGPVVDTQSQLAFGVDMAKRGLWSEALFRFRQAERERPGDPQVLNNMAVAYEALGQFDKALEYYQSAIKGDPANKDLKRNYSRFVEFYRNFRPDEQQGTESEARLEPDGP